MYQDQTLHWLTTNEQYARVIAGLAGLRTYEVKGEGLGFDVAAAWTGEGWKGPVVYRVYTENGYLAWPVNSLDSLLFKRTLGQLTESFTQMKLPPAIIVFHGIINMDNKKPHFLGFESVREPKTLEHVRPMMWVATEGDFEKTAKSVLFLRRKLEGIGYKDD